MTQTIDRSADISQPLDRLSTDETIKAESDYLRGKIRFDLLDWITGGVTFESNKLMKFHGIYQQDDRDIRDERRRQKLEPAYTFMVRVRLPGGVCTAEQWLKVDELARAHGGNTIRLTTRQTFQFHWIVKEAIRPAIEGLHSVLLDTIAACGDDARGVMATAHPTDSALDREVAELSKALSDHVIPRMNAYHEIWLGQERIATSEEEEEPLYGPTYLPRKFKIGFAIPPSNDVDIYTQDLGLIAIGDQAGLEGFNLVIGGGMGRADNDPNTYPRLGDVIGFIPKERLIDVATAVIAVQRDYGNRAHRPRARFKYTVDDKGLDFIKGEIERRLGAPLGPTRPFAFESNSDRIGWYKTDNGLWNLGLFIENGRIADKNDKLLLTALRNIATIHRGQFRLTPNQNLIVAGVTADDRESIDVILSTHGLGEASAPSGLRRNSIACVALPTCPLAMAEAERYLPLLNSKIETLLADHGLADEPITIRMSGCPNGCSRPYVAEIALTGRGPGRYDLWLGGSHLGARLNRMVAENIAEDRILEILAGTFSDFTKERIQGERFGDFVARTGAWKNGSA